jgi:hypothetical protein
MNTISKTNIIYPFACILRAKINKIIRLFLFGNAGFTFTWEKHIQMQYCTLNQNYEELNV